MSGNSKFPWYKERLKTKYSKDVSTMASSDIVSINFCVGGSVGASRD